jgi:hypothetical protein
MLVHLWLWMWFVIGSLLSTFKRAYFKIQGPDPDVTTYSEYIKKYWVPILFRGFTGAAIFWLTFYPAILETILGWIHWDIKVPSFPPVGVVALLAGLGLDWGLDFLSGRFGWFKSFVPQGGILKDGQVLALQAKINEVNPNPPDVS